MGNSELEIQNVKKNYLRDTLDALLADKELAVTQTKVIGCSTKWAGKEAQVATGKTRSRAQQDSERTHCDKTEWYCVTTRRSKKEKQ